MQKYFNKHFRCYALLFQTQFSDEELHLRGGEEGVKVVHGIFSGGKSCLVSWPGRLGSSCRGRVPRNLPGPEAIGGKPGNVSGEMWQCGKHSRCGSMAEGWWSSVRRASINFEI